MTPRNRSEHQRLLDDALAREREAHRLLLAGEAGQARGPLREAADLYRRSWEGAPPQAYGRLVGMLKASVLAGDPGRGAAYARRELGDEADSPASSYGLALAALIAGDDEVARRAASGMRSGSPAFERTAQAIEALVDGDRERYREAVAAIVADFESRPDHLTGVPIADTALCLEKLAEARGMATRLRSPLLPPA